MDGRGDKQRQNIIIKGFKVGPYGPYNPYNPTEEAKKKDKVKEEKGKRFFVLESIVVSLSLALVVSRRKEHVNSETSSPSQVWQATDRLNRDGLRLDALSFSPVLLAYLVLPCLSPLPPPLSFPNASCVPCSFLKLPNQKSCLYTSPFLSRG